MNVDPAKQLELYSPFIIESLFRGFDVKEVFPDFFRVNCPKFSGFRQIRQDIAANGPCHGKGYDLQMQLVHNEFLTSLEDLINEKLRKVGVSPEGWEGSMITQMQVQAASSSVGVGPRPEGSLQVFLGSLRQYEDFFAFGEMMEDLCTRLYGHRGQEEGHSGIGATHGGAVVPEPMPMDTTPPAGSATRDGGASVGTSGDSALPPVTGHGDPPGGGLPAKYVRVLWDIENIPPLTNRQLKACGGEGAGEGGTLRTVMLLEQFLVAQGLAGPGVDTRLTTFVNFMDMKERRAREPQAGSAAGQAAPGAGDRGRGGAAGGGLDKQVLYDLDKANVEIVFASRKREDADRKLCNRMLQEMGVMSSLRAGGEPRDLEPAASMTGAGANHPNSAIVFVIISSDQDFRHMFELARNQGFRVICLHRAEGARWQQSLELYTTQSFHWDRDVMLLGGRATTDPAIRDALVAVAGDGRDRKAKRRDGGNVEPPARHVSGGGRGVANSYAAAVGGGAGAICGTVVKSAPRAAPAGVDARGGGVLFRVGLLVRRCSPTHCFGDVLSDPAPICLCLGDGRQLSVGDSVFVHCSSIDPAAVVVGMAKPSVAADLMALGALGIYQQHVTKGSVLEATVSMNEKGWTAVAVGGIQPSK